LGGMIEARKKMTKKSEGGKTGRPDQVGCGRGRGKAKDIEFKRRKYRAEGWLGAS